jgi:hypothetical protein
MRAQEFITEQADYVHPSIFLAVKRAQETGGKVVRSVGGYFKVVPQNAPGEEYEIDPTAPQRKRDLEQAAEAKRAEIKKNLTIYVHGDDNERYDALKAYNRGKRDLTQILKDIRAVVNYKPVSKEPVTEAFVLTPILLKWAQGQAVKFLRQQITAKGQGVIADNQTLRYVDQSIANALGQQDREVGSILTAYVINLIQSGNPLEAALKTGLGLAKEMAMQSDTVQGFKSQAMDYLRQLEPMADQWEAVLSRRTQAPAPVGQAGQQDQLEPIDGEQDPLQQYIQPGTAT